MTNSILRSNNLELFEVESQNTLFVPFLGQSHGKHLSSPPYVWDSASYSDSGATTLRDELSKLTNYNIVTSTSENSNFSVGNSQVNGNALLHDKDDSLTWWYPEDNRPGGVLLAAEQELKQWLDDNEAQPTDQIAIVWSQGESDAGDIDVNNGETREAYKQSTIAVFDYLKNSLEFENITYYIVPTGRFQKEAASNAGALEEEIAVVEAGLIEVRGVQSEIASQRDDVHLTPDYSDLNTVYQEGQIYGDSYYVDYQQWSTDSWHLGRDGLKVDGSRIAQYIALDQEQNSVVSFTDSFGNPAQSISISRSALLDIDLPNYGNLDIRGTDNPDLIVGSLENDRIRAKGGNDVIISGGGFDTLTGGSDNDIFFYSDMDGKRDLILDFEPGNDRLDLSEPLKLSGYNGNNPIADGYIVVESVGERYLIIGFDEDGLGGDAVKNVVLIKNTDHAECMENIDEQFILMPTEF